MHTKRSEDGAILTVIFIAALCFSIFACIINIMITPVTAWGNCAFGITEPVNTNVSAIVDEIKTCTKLENDRIVILEEPTYPLSEEEINLIALVTMGEAEGETELGKRLVIDTILNRTDDSHFPDTVAEVIYQPNQFSAMWDGRIDRCYIMPEIVELVKEELLERTNSDVIFFMAGGYSAYGTPMFQECCHYFSSYK